MYHIPVLVDEVLTYLVTNEKGTYLDVTAGGGGHSYALLKKYPKIKMILSDWDLDAIKECQKRLSEFEDRITIIQSSFSNLAINLKKIGITYLHGILADFGTSQHQLVTKDGFSFAHDSFLDMRMSNSHRKILAVDILRSASYKEIRDIFYYYGNEPQASKIAKEITLERKTRPIRTSLHLVSIIERFVFKKGKVHPATKIFQALRIAVNKELEEIEALFKIIPNFLIPRSRIACISFHSLEDGLVKKFFVENKKSFKIVGDKIIKPTQEEIDKNPACRSSKLRILEKIE